jgi:hypothetical protein
VYLHIPGSTGGCWNKTTVHATLHQSSQGTRKVQCHDSCVFWALSRSAHLGAETHCSAPSTQLGVTCTPRQHITHTWALHMAVNTSMTPHSFHSDHSWFSTALQTLHHRVDCIHTASVTEAHENAETIRRRHHRLLPHVCCGSLEAPVGPDPPYDVAGHASSIHTARICAAATMSQGQCTQVNHHVLAPVGAHAHTL